MDIIKADEQLISINAFRILLRYVSDHTQIFFQEKRDPVTGLPLKKKEPVTLFIDHAGVLNDIPLECISKVMFRLTEDPRLVFVCNTKVRLELSFILLMLVTYEGTGNYELITLPEDIGFNVTTLYDLTEKQIANSAVQTLQWVGDHFVYTLTVPFSDFEGTLPPGLLDSEALRGNVTLRNMEWAATIDGVSFDGTSSPPVLATRVDLSVSQDILLRVGIEEGILVNGTVE